MTQINDQGCRFFYHPKAGSEYPHPRDYVVYSKHKNGAGVVALSLYVLSPAHRVPLIGVGIRAGELSRVVRNLADLLALGFVETDEAHFRMLASRSLYDANF